MVYSNYTKKSRSYADAEQQTHTSSYFVHPMTYWFLKDIGLLVEGDDGDNDGLCLDVFQIGLRQHPHSLAAPVLGEDERIAAQAHGARLETVPVHADGLLTGLT